MDGTFRTRYTSSSALTTLDGGPARGCTEVPQVERAIAVHLCPQNAATWRGRPRLPSRACKFSSSLVAKAFFFFFALHAMAIRGRPPMSSAEAPQQPGPSVKPDQRPTTRRKVAPPAHHQATRNPRKASKHS